MYVVMFPFDQDDKVLFETEDKEEAIAVAKKLCKDNDKPCLAGGTCCGGIHLFFPDE